MTRTLSSVVWVHCRLGRLPRDGPPRRPPRGAAVCFCSHTVASLLQVLLIGHSHVSALGSYGAGRPSRFQFLTSALFQPQPRARNLLSYGAVCSGWTQVLHSHPEKGQPLTAQTLLSFHHNGLVPLRRNTLGHAFSSHLPQLASSSLGSREVPFKRGSAFVLYLRFIWHLRCGARGGLSLTAEFTEHQVFC